MSHRGQKTTLGILFATGLLGGVLGCQDSARKPVQVHPVEIAPQAVREALPQILLPLDARRGSKALTPLLVFPPNGVEWLAAQSQAAFDAGEQDFRAGRLGKAREEFDEALDQLLASGFDIDADPRLSGLYRHIVDTVNADELEAFRDGDGFKEQKATPAPIDEIAEVPIPENENVDPNLRGRAEGEVTSISHDLPLMVNDPVLAYLNYFKTARGSAIVETGLRRAGRYREMVQRVLREEGMPQDLIYLAQAESAFLPQAVSRAGARGMWQFMSYAGRKYGLEKTWWVDERQDPEKATRAAARDLRELYEQFGDWYLAMAAYNSGPGRVQSAVKRTGYADFWELYRRNVLPRETRNYVPIIVAVAIMAKNPSQYGLQTVVPDPPMTYDTVKINYPVDLRLVSECIDVPPSELQELNPSLLRMTTPKSHFDLHLPVGTEQKYQAAIASIPAGMRLWWRYHTVASGETLISLARTYRTPMKTIAMANQLDMSDTIEAGAKLVIPIAPGRHSSGDGQTYARHLTVYRVRKNDTLETVSNNLGIAPATIRRWNRMKGDSLAGRRVLYVHLPVSPTVAAAEHQPTPKSQRSSELADNKSGSSVRHTVKRGETLYSIANNYKTSVKAIKQTNANVATLRPGMVLVIPAQ